MKFCTLKKIRKKIPALLLLLSWAGYVHGQDLSQIQKQIKQQEQKIAEQKREQNKLQSTLKQQEGQISNVIGQLRQTETGLQEIRKTINETNKQVQRLKKQEKEQKAKLAKQLDHLYRLGYSQNALEKLISEQGQNEDRMKVYARHLNQVRLQMIEDLRNTQAQLEQDQQLLLDQQKEQQGQLSQQKKQQQELQKVKNERQSTLNQLSRSLEKDQNKLESLKANESALRQEIQRAEQNARQQEIREREAYAQKKQAEEKKNNKPYQPTAQEQQLMRVGGGLGAAKKQYAFPVGGKIINRFGSPQMGELRWKGIVIAASAGAPVKAIADGRVILANWLQGYGLVVVIDHGKGDMSLYGYNQSTSVRSGSLVKAGQKIAEVGNSGGQGRSALYFEIRRQGNAVNPMGWLK